MNKVIKYIFTCFILLASLIAFPQQTYARYDAQVLYIENIEQQAEDDFFIVQNAYNTEITALNNRNKTNISLNVLFAPNFYRNNAIPMFSSNELLGCSNFVLENSFKNPQQIRAP